MIGSSLESALKNKTEQKPSKSWQHGLVSLCPAWDAILAPQEQMSPSQYNLQVWEQQDTRGTNSPGLMRFGSSPPSLSENHNQRLLWTPLGDFSL